MTEPPNPPTSGELERQLAAAEAVASQLVGLALGEARNIAGQERLQLEDITSLSAITMDLRPGRIRIRLDPAGVVLEASAG